MPAAPMALASSPCSELSMAGMANLVVKARLSTVRRTSSKRISPALATPPPITTISGPNRFTALAMPMPR